MPYVPKPHDWPPEQNELLRILWAKGHVSSEIAEIMGKTRNAVIGRAHRMGLAMRRVGYDPRKEKRTPDNRPGKRLAPMKPAARPLNSPDSSCLINLFDINRFGCRYIEGEASWQSMMCGHPIYENHSYCEFHYNYCHMKVRSVRSSTSQGLGTGGPSEVHASVCGQGQDEGPILSINKEAA